MLRVVHRRAVQQIRASGASSLRYPIVVRYGRTFSSSSLYDELNERGFVQQATHPTVLRESLENGQRAVYLGVDPTAQALHIGHLLPFMCLLHFQIRGHRIIPLIGGATGRIGDPSGRKTERAPAVTRQVEENIVSLTSSIQRFFEKALGYATERLGRSKDPKDSLQQPAILSNLEWHKDFTMLDFLQYVGIHARVNTMLNRESVKARLESQQGLSFTEFSYQLLQAYDFYHLNKHHQCSIQIGGSDQWGNVLAGIELIGKLNATQNQARPEVFAVTTPLLTTSTGEKFGKSAGNAVWLDSTLTPVFDFYQYFVKVEDADVEKYLKLFTLLPVSEIQAIVDAHKQNPEKRSAQRRLADEVTGMVHSVEELEHARTITRLLFDSDYAGLKATSVIDALSNDSRLVVLDKEELLGTTVTRLASKHKLAASGSAAKSLVQGRGLYANNKTVPDIQFKLSESDLIDNRVAIIRAGKDKHLILAVKE